MACSYRARRRDDVVRLCSLFYEGRCVHRILHEHAVDELLALSIYSSIYVGISHEMVRLDQCE